MSNREEITANVERIPLHDLPREIAFAKAALDVDDPATVYWLAALYARYETKIGFAA
jgi:hypothetical protein